MEYRIMAPGVAQDSGDAAPFRHISNPYLSRAAPSAPGPLLQQRPKFRHGPPFGVYSFSPPFK